MLRQISPAAREEEDWVVVSDAAPTPPPLGPLPPRGPSGPSEALAAAEGRGCRTWGRPAVLPLPVHLHQADASLPDPRLQRRLVLGIHSLTPELQAEGQVGMADRTRTPSAPACRPHWGPRAPAPSARGKQGDALRAKHLPRTPAWTAWLCSWSLATPFIISSLPTRSHSGSFPTPAPTPRSAHWPGTRPRLPGGGGASAREPRGSTNTGVAGPGGTQTAAPSREPAGTFTPCLLFTPLPALVLGVGGPILMRKARSVH